jgi:hypothetical protein
MSIACLGWGSLIWDPRELPVEPEWHKDGPLASVEFTRQSSDGRITLVLDPQAVPVTLLWARMAVDDLAAAKEHLRRREQITAKEWSSLIGSWKVGDPEPSTIHDLPLWADSHGIDAVIWTALSPRFPSKRKGQSPSADEVIAHLEILEGARKLDAKRYIELAPSQIDTEYRRRIKAALGWS